ncbi:D-tyrosyl-tRNA(Tyr) deacylase [Candidatus Gottesmanbacteria bacterium]|nr:D-tyrosyl-tRNA(Tyr) deacylase [Candidatus Gottesmanbacteria bacterium]MBI5452714.1 D-tyrosyl-tRNA(Tyr) deacylase [Candidatus Gottesmanbacteria bacterium]
MKALLQRVLTGKVSISGKVIGEIGKGYVILLGVKTGDSEKEADLMASKIVNLRIMSDENDKMNKSILDVAGEILVVSQFTLYADTTGGRRPSFIKAAKPDVADHLYQYFVDKLKKLGVKNVQTGEFGAYMSVEIVNDGPVTIMLDSEEL